MHARAVRQFLMCTAMAVCCVASAETATRYHLRVRAAPTLPMRLVFALTCSDSGSNTLTLLNAQTDGSFEVTSSTGGPMHGKLLAAANPADTTTVVGGTFYSELVLKLQSTTLFDCDLDLTENAATSGRALSELALHYLAPDGTVGMSTGDALGANAIGAVDITGNAGGDLALFYPLTFVAPDTLLFDGQLLGVPVASVGRTRIIFDSIAPNPSRSLVLFAFTLTTAGVASLKIYDVVGRLVAQPLAEQRQAGESTASWNLRAANGRPVAPGSYIAELRVGDQTAVRRFVIMR